MSPTLLLLLSLWACDDYSSVAKADTIEAYEAYLAGDPGETNAFRATVRLEELYLARARASKSLEDWDAYLARWPEGVHRETALKERESALFAWADSRATSAAWQKYVDEYPSAPRKNRVKAEAAVEAIAFAERWLKVSELSTRKINLAEDPAGPLNGTAYTYEVTLSGDKTLDAFWFELQYFGKDDQIVDRKAWPLVAPYGEYPVPVEDEKYVPMKPGETRTWEWWAEAEPEGFTGKLRLVPLRMRLAKEG
jgi:hypothetical protein